MKTNKSDKFHFPELHGKALQLYRMSKRALKRGEVSRARSLFSRLECKIIGNNWPGCMIRLTWLIHFEEVL